MFHGRLEVCFTVNNWQGSILLDQFRQAESVISHKIFIGIMCVTVEVCKKHHAGGINVMNGNCEIVFKAVHA